MKIIFDKGVLIPEGEMYTLILSHQGKQVYAATLDRETAAEVVDQHNNVTIKTT
jgi:hypothetical protein